jgi:hypothetical protein
MAEAYSQYDRWTEVPQHHVEPEMIPSNTPPPPRLPKVPITERLRRSSTARLERKLARQGHWKGKG